MAAAAGIGAGAIVGTVGLFCYMRSDAGQVFDGAGPAYNPYDVEGTEMPQV